MRFLTPLVAAILVAGLSMACQQTSEDDEPVEHPEQRQTQPQPVEMASDEDTSEDEQMTFLEPSEHSRQLMDQIRDYWDWDYHADLDTHYESGHPGDVWVISYANESGGQAVEEGRIPVPEGAIYVKEEYDADGADDPFAVTVMEKLSDERGDWYWMKADPDLEQIVEGPGEMALEGTEDLGCIDCHGAAADDDYLMAPGL